MAKVLTGADLSIDATHPMPEKPAGISGKQQKRQMSPATGFFVEKANCRLDCILVNSTAEAARFLQSTEGNILLTTGAKELTAFSTVERQRLVPRVLPVQESLAACEGMGIPRSNVIAMQGPFSCELNTALIHQFSIQWLVTKDGGAAGGFAEKAQAARQTGTHLVVIRRPKEDGEPYETILKLCKEMMGCR